MNTTKLPPGLKNKYIKHYLTLAQYNKIEELINKKKILVRYIGEKEDKRVMSLEGKEKEINKLIDLMEKNA